VENRNGLVVDAEVTQASGTAEREAALRMMKRSVRRHSTLGVDKGYDAKGFVQSLRKKKVTPHVAAKRVGFALNGRTTRQTGYAISLKKSLAGQRRLVVCERHASLVWQRSRHKRFLLLPAITDADGDIAWLAFVICIGRDPPIGRQKASKTPKGDEKQAEIRLSDTTKA
jgi:hypothetical protein